MKKLAKLLLVSTKPKRGPLASRPPANPAALKRRARLESAGTAPATDYKWLIILAKYPAPKPLSIFTTLTPLAQEFSMESSAARPPKAAPYPTLVGTAITGQSDRPR